MAVVTGASTGIGRATARMLKERGWQVFPTARNRTDMDLLRGEGFQPVELDLADPDSVAHAAKEILELSQGARGGGGEQRRLWPARGLGRSVARRDAKAVRNERVRDLGFHEPVHSGVPGAAVRADRAGEFGGGAGGDSADGRILREQVRAGGDRRRTADGTGAGGHFGFAGGAGADRDEFPAGGRSASRDAGWTSRNRRSPSNMRRNWANRSGPIRGRRTSSASRRRRWRRKSCMPWNRAVRTCAIR